MLLSPLVRSLGEGGDIEPLQAQNDVSTDHVPNPLRTYLSSASTAATGAKLLTTRWTIGIFLPLTL